jgi:hypothetical protein
VFFHDRVAERQLWMEAVDVATTLVAALDIAGVFEVAQNAVGVTLADVCRRRNFPDANARSLSNSE